MFENRKWVHRLPCIFSRFDKTLEWLVHIDGLTQGRSIFHANIASHGKNCSWKVMKSDWLVAYWLKIMRHWRLWTHEAAAVITWAGNSSGLQLYTVAVYHQHAAVVLSRRRNLSHSLTCKSSLPHLRTEHLPSAVHHSAHGRDQTSVQLAWQSHTTSSLFSVKKVH